jgi:thioester reductase-like protein
LLRTVTEEIAAVLSLSSGMVAPNQRLSDLGLDSLMALQLRNKLARLLGVTLPASLMVDARVSSAQAIADRLCTALSGPGDGGEAAFLRAEARIDDNLRGMGKPHDVEPRVVLLTGVTGFLGASLLVELCQQTSAEVVCLVRGKSPADARRRVVDNLRKYGLWDEAFAGRFSVVVGDLGQPLLGLSEGEFLELSNRLDAIYSNGAHVSFTAGYEELKPSHVGATSEILRLASMGRAKVIHHVSSITVYWTSAYRGRTLPESSPPEVCEDLLLPYAQCKWVTEAMVREASARGVPIVIYRPGVIGGSSISGAWNTDDFLCRMMKGTVEMGCVPGPLDIVLDFTPVDYVARSLVYLSLQADSVGRAFNLHHPKGLGWEEYRHVLQTLGHKADSIPYDDWVEQIDSTRHEALYPLLPFLRLRDAAQLSYVERVQRRYRAELTCHETTAELAKANIVCPPIDAALIGRYLAYLESLGYIAKKADSGTGFAAQ